MLLEKELLSKITYEPARIAVAKLHDEYKAIKDIVTDKDPDDKAQIAAWWEANKEELTADTIEGVMASIQYLIKNGVDAQQVIDLFQIKLQEQKDREAIMPGPIVK